MTYTVEWLEDELMEIMRLVSKGLYGDTPDDELTDALRLHGIRLLLEADIEKYEAVLERWELRQPPQNGGDKR